MFNKEYSFKGKHAEYVIGLTSPIDKGSNKLFNRNLDVYILAPIVGFLYNRRAPVDKESNKETKIFGDILMKNGTTLKYNFKLIMLLADVDKVPVEERINRAFRYNEHAEQMAGCEDLYEQYVRGGVEVLYEKLVHNVVETDDYLKRLYDFLEEVKDRWNDETSFDDILDLCKLARI